MKVTNRTTLLTGGSAGIGLGFACRFLELGNMAIVTGRRQEALYKASAVKTEFAEGFDNAGIKTMPTVERMERTFAALRAGKSEIRPDQANLLAARRRIGPNFINRQLWGTARSLLPAAQY